MPFLRPPVLLLAVAVASIQSTQVSGAKGCSIPVIRNFSVSWNDKSNKATVMWTPKVLASEVTKAKKLCKKLRYEVRSLEWTQPNEIPDNLQNVTKVVTSKWSRRTKRYWLKLRHIKKQLTAKFPVKPLKFYTFSVVIGRAKTLDIRPNVVQVSRLLFTGAQDPARIIEPLQDTTFVVPKGQPFSVKCVATGVPSPTVYWASANPFDSFLLLPQSPPEELEIVPTEPGIYQCIAMNTVVNRDYSKSSHPPDVVSITVVVK